MPARDDVSDTTRLRRAYEHACAALAPEVDPHLQTSLLAFSSSTNGSSAQIRGVLGDVLIANSRALSESALCVVDTLMEAEAEQPLAVTPEALGDEGSLWLHHPSGTQLVVWQGDIRRLSIDAVMNAANEQGLGCFQPSHRCIDNLLHRAAGPRLREAARKGLQQRPSASRSLPPGGAPLVTPGYHLPCKVTRTTP
jgi:hypothetical protein